MTTHTPGTVRLTGDNAQFTGAIHVGYAHLYATDGAGLPRGANLAFSNESGRWHTCGTVTRAPGTGAGEISWRAVPGVANTTDCGTAGGGFTADGGDLTVNLGGDGRVLKGGDVLPAGYVALQTAQAANTITVENAIDVNSQETVRFNIDGVTQPVVFNGDVSNTGGGEATLEVYGAATAEFNGQTTAEGLTIHANNGATVKFACAAAEIDIANPGARLFTVLGNAAIADGSAVRIVSDEAALKALRQGQQELEIEIGRATTLTGAYARETNLRDWTIRVRDNKVYARWTAPGMMIIVR